MTDPARRRAFYGLNTVFSEVFGMVWSGKDNYVFCVFSSHSFWTSMDVPAGVTEKKVTGFSIHLLSAVLALIFIAKRIQPFLSLVDREVECVLTI